MFSRVDLKIADIVPRDWYSDPEESSVWLSGYRMMRVSLVDLPTGSRHFDLHRARILLCYGTVAYLDPAAATPRVTDEARCLLDAGQLEKRTPEGAYLIILLPFDVDGQDGDERAARARLEDIVGLVAVVNQRNMVYERVFDYVYRLSGNERSVIGEPILNPQSMPAPRLDQPNLAMITALDDAIDSAAPARRARIRLSLRWFKSALYDSGVDAFLKYWIAIETLSMPNTTNIRPINKALAEINAMSVEEASLKYHVGRVFGLRARIVHKGEQVPIGGGLIDYLESLYADLLFHATDFPPQRRAAHFLASSRFDPEAHFRTI